MLLESVICMDENKVIRHCFSTNNKEKARKYADEEVENVLDGLKNVKSVTDINHKKVAELLEYKHIVTWKDSQGSERSYTWIVMTSRAEINLTL